MNLFPVQLLEPPLQAFINQLALVDRPLNEHELSDFLANSQISLDVIRPYLSFHDDFYTRNRIALLPHVELLVLGWRPGQLSPIHDHSGSSCAVKILQGRAKEITFQISEKGGLREVDTQYYYQGQVTSSFDDDIHMMGNDQSSTIDLISLHCYSPPITAMRIFEHES